MRYYFLSRNYEQKQKLSQEPKHITTTSSTRENIDSSFHIFPQVVILGLNYLHKKHISILHLFTESYLRTCLHEKNPMNNETKQA